MMLILFFLVIITIIKRIEGITGTIDDIKHVATFLACFISFNTSSLVFVCTVSLEISSNNIANKYCASALLWSID